MKKCNIPCSSYRKFGKCNGKDNRTCIKLHNPDQVTLCPRFLQGDCHKQQCLLSHKVTPQKMPTCKYYLEGSCSKDDCPYLHVKINPKADICKDFIQGFCKKGIECEKRHQYLCPMYEKNGVCLKKKCKFPHGDDVNVVRKNIISTNSKIIIAKKSTKTILKGTCSTTDNQKNSRYYDLTENSNLETVTVSKPKLGQLSTFIPLLKEI